MDFSDMVPGRRAVQYTGTLAANAWSALFGSLGILRVDVQYHADISDLCTGLHYFAVLSNREQKFERIQWYHEYPDFWLYNSNDSDLVMVWQAPRSWRAVDCVEWIQNFKVSKTGFDRKGRMSHQQRALTDQELEADHEDVVGDGSVDIRGRPSRKTTSGRWGAAYFIMGVQLAERTAYYCIVLNLVTYLVRELHEGTEKSSTTVFNWAGAVWILPLLGGFLADAYIGRFYMIVASTVIYILGLIVLALSMSLSGLRPPPCPTLVNCTPTTKTQQSIFYLALYGVAIGIGGISPCLSSFGADQFNEDDEEEKRMKRSFFDYWGIAVAGGGVVALSFIIYVQDRVSWGWGYAIPTFGMGLALVLLLCGISKYRHQPPTGSPLTEVAQVFTAAILNAKKGVPADPSMLYDVDVKGKHKILHTNTLSFLDKAAVVDMKHEGALAPSQVDPTDSEMSTLKVNPWRLCSVSQDEEIKLLVRVMPIWIFSLMFMVHVTQLTSFFLRQSLSMDLSMGPNFKIPAASMTIFNSLTAILCIPVYDYYFVPFMRRFTGNERGISMLQRIGAGLAITTIAMVVAAGVEIKRLDVIKEHGLEDKPTVPVPMSVFWLLPQYMILGVAEILVIIGQIEFFYDQAPEHMQSIGTALYTTNTAVAHFVCTGIVQLVVRTTGSGNGGWIENNINRCRIDKYYWLLAILGAVNLVFYVLVAKSYTYKKVERRL